MNSWRRMKLTTPAIASDAVDRRGAVLQHLDPLDRRQRNAVDVDRDRVAGEADAVRRDAPAVEQDERAQRASGRAARSTRCRRWSRRRPTPKSVAARAARSQLTVCISCSTLVAPDFWMSSRVITCTGKAVSASMRLIDEPVISTRSSCCCGGVAGGVCARAGSADDAASERRSSSSCRASFSSTSGLPRKESGSNRPCRDDASRSGSVSRR